MWKGVETSEMPNLLLVDEDNIIVNFVEQSNNCSHES